MTKSRIWRYPKSGRPWAALHLVWISAVIIGCVSDVLLVSISPEHGDSFTWATQSFHIAYRIVLWVALWYGVFYGINAFHILLKTRQLIGHISRMTRNKMKQLALVSHQYRLIRGGNALLFFLGLFGILLFVAFNDTRMLSLSTLSLGVLLWLRVRISMPPIALLLASSNQCSIARHWAYKRFVSPLRVISLLDKTGRIDDRKSSELEFDCLRTNNDNDWWVVITTLMDFAPLLLFDATATTEGVIRERDYVISSGLLYKSMFARGSEGECPLIDSLPDEIRSGLCCVVETTALKKIYNVLVTGCLPTTARPLAQLLY
ncbi:hypothetical protein K8R14_05280 [bacterium]|nr:hypothetical protein [bacterium]